MSRKSLAQAVPALLKDLDLTARLYDSVEYGLPLDNPILFESLRSSVLMWILKNYDDDIEAVQDIENSRYLTEG